MTVRSSDRDRVRSGPDRWPEPQRALEAGIDFENANAARMYDYFLGGAHNFAVDRERVEEVIAAHPGAVRIARENRAFLGRAVRWCLGAGIEQFLDLGSGVPTVGNVHEIAHQHIATARVAYVDFEPVAVAHSGTILAEQAVTDRVTITRADLRDPASVLTAPGVADLLDLTRPTALLAVSVLHFVPDGVRELLETYAAALAPGSAIVLSHSSDDYDDPELVARMRAGVAVYRNSATPIHQRSRAELHALLAGFDVVGPGLVDVVDWPVGTDEPTGHYGAIARRP